MLTGCAFGYARVAEPAGTDTQPEAEVRVWTHGRVLRLHGTTFLLDSITGIPVHDPFECDSCRVGLALTEVDSVFLQRQVGRDMKNIGQALVFSMLMYGL